MASGNMKIGIITECIQQLIIKLLNVLCFVSLSLLKSVLKVTLNLNSLHVLSEELYIIMMLELLCRFFHFSDEDEIFFGLICVQSLSFRPLDDKS